MIAAVVACLSLPEFALASGGITQFTGPIEMVVDTLTGPAGKAISVIMMAITGIYYIANKEDISGGFKLMLGVVFGIAFICFSGGIIDTVFSFNAAVIGGVS